MSLKLMTPVLVTLLRKGDIIKRISPNHAQAGQDELNEPPLEHIDTYEILSINCMYDVFSLVSVNLRNRIMAAPVDIGRLFISACNLTAEKVWWIDS